MILRATSGAATLGLVVLIAVKTLFDLSLDRRGATFATS